MQPHGAEKSHLSPPPDSPVSQGGELQAMVEDFLGIILRMANASAGAVMLLSADEKNLQLIGALGLSAETRRQAGTVDRECGICGEVLRKNAVRFCAASECTAKCKPKNARFIVSVPLEYHDSVIGVFCLFFREEFEVTADAAMNYRSFGRLIGIALENTRESREHRRTILLAERQQMANEIHDSLAQTLVFARMRMSLLADACMKDEALAKRCIKDVDEALAHGQKSARELITHFRSQMDPEGLQHALQELAEGFRGRTGIKLDYSNRVADLDLPLEYELQAFHIVRELMSNIANHSAATEALLTVEEKDGNFLFSISDNGKGFLPSSPKEGSYGLKIICERAARIGGKIDIVSADRAGTRVTLSFPAPEV